MGTKHMVGCLGWVGDQTPFEDLQSVEYSTGIDCPP